LIAGFILKISGKISKYCTDLIQEIYWSVCCIKIMHIALKKSAKLTIEFKLPRRENFTFSIL